MTHQIERRQSAPAPEFRAYDDTSHGWAASVHYPDGRIAFVRESDLVRIDDGGEVIQ